MNQSCADILWSLDFVAGIFYEFFLINFIEEELIKKQELWSLTDWLAVTKMEMNFDLSASQLSQSISAEIDHIKCRISRIRGVLWLGIWI